MKKVFSIILLLAILSMTSCSEPTYNYDGNSSSFSYDDTSGYSADWSLPSFSYNQSYESLPSYFFHRDDNTDSSSETEPPSSQSSTQVTVYITATGKKYHLYSCQSLWSSAYAVTVDEAWNAGYYPCLKCMPPLPDFVELKY